MLHGFGWLRAVASPTLLLLMSAVAAPAQDVFERVDHHYADSDGVSIHYATLGSGPLVVMIHGFPDFWYSWRDQMLALAEAGFRVAAMDTRGYNLSDKPERVDAYAMKLLVDDVSAVVAAEGVDDAIVVGHDWGGIIAWNVGMRQPSFLRGLVVLNMPHPAALARELATNPDQERNSQYARNFQAEGSHERLSASGLTGWVRDPDARARYVEAFERSSLFGMMSYYKANYPSPPYEEIPDGVLPQVLAPVLHIHGLEDQYLLASGLDGTWEWVAADYTLVTLPGIGHFVQQDASESVTEAILMWLRR
ncbi:MAG: alpha/beta hydrolase [Gemmatimonadota bacterium]